MILRDFSLLKRIAMARHSSMRPLGGILLEPDGDECLVLATNGPLMAWGRERVDGNLIPSSVLIPREMAACVEKSRYGARSYLEVLPGPKTVFRLHLCDGRPDLVMEAVNEAPLYPAWRKAVPSGRWRHMPELYYQQRLIRCANEILVDDQDMEMMDFRELALSDCSGSISVATRNGIFVAIGAKKFAEFQGPEESIDHNAINEEMAALREFL